MKKIDKTIKAIKGLVDFNNFIRDEVVEPEQKSCLVQQLVMSNEKSLTPTDNEKMKATNLYNALDSKSVFYATDKITKTIVRKARNSLYNDWAAKTDNNELIIGNLFDYQKLNLGEKILMPLVQFNNGLFIRSGIELYTCIKELRGTTNSI